MAENDEPAGRTYNNDDCAALDQITLEAFLDDPGAGMYVESRKDIVKQDSCCPGVDRSCECHTCLF